MSRLSNLQDTFEAVALQWTRVDNKDAETVRDALYTAVSYVTFGQSDLCFFEGRCQSAKRRATKKDPSGNATRALDYPRGASSYDRYAQRLRAERIEKRWPIDCCHLDRYRTARRALVEHHPDAIGMLALLHSIRLPDV